MLYRVRANDQQSDARLARILRVFCRGEMNKTASNSSMKHPLPKRLWGFLVCLVVTGTSCTSAPSPMGRAPSYDIWGIGKPIGTYTRDGKLSGETVPDSVWATAEDRKQYKPLVVALAQQDSLLQRPGVVGVRAGYEELQVYTTNPATLPPQVWGVPIKTFSPSECSNCMGGEAVPDKIPPEIPAAYNKYFQ